MNHQGLLALAELILPSEILSNFEVVRVEQDSSLIRIYLDESVKAEYEENPDMESKGFCDAVTIRDFPIPGKGVGLIVRRRRWRDRQASRYFSAPPMTSRPRRPATRRSLRLFKKECMETIPTTSRSLDHYYHINGDTFEKQHREILSGCREWPELSHAEEWFVFPENKGDSLCIDEITPSNGELYTVVTNRASRGVRGGARRHRKRRVRRCRYRDAHAH